MREINHRSKNLLAVVQSIARNSARGGSPATFAEDLSQRLRGLSASQDLLIESQWKAVSLANLVKSQLSHLSEPMASRISIQGQTILISPSAAQGIGMALHELATNALKYGALSNENGLVDISWNVTRADGVDEFCMHWRERCGPTVNPPTQSGFGRTVIERMVAHAVGGRVTMDYAKDGFSWSLTAPQSNVSSDGRL